MRLLLLLGVLSLALPAAVATQQPRPAAPDPALIQTFIDAAPGAAREQILAEAADLRAPEARVALQRLGVTHAKQGRTPEAVRAYEAAMELAALTDAPRTRISALIGLGMVYGQAGEYRTAADRLNEALTLATEAKDDEMVASAGNNLGNIYRRRAEFEPALESYRRALASHEAAGREEQVARTLNNLGLTYQEQGDFRSALEYYLRSLELKERVSPPDDVISTIGNIGSLYTLQGNHTQAIDYLERALTLGERARTVRLNISVLGNIARLLLEAGRYDDAAARFTRALRLAEQSGFSEQRAGALAGLGRVEAARGKLTKATGHFVQARAIFDEIGDPIGTGRVLAQLARIELDRGSPAGAAALADLARTTLAATGTPTALIDAESLYGEALTALGRWDDAIASYERAIALSERELTLVAGGTEDRMRYLDGVTSAYFGLANAYAAAGRAADALRAAERGRARTLLDILAGGDAGAGELTPAERERQIELNAAMLDLNQRVAAERTRASSRPGAEASINADLDRLRRRRDEFYLGLDARHPRLRFARGEAPPLSVEEIAATLPRRTALIEFVVGTRDAWVLALLPQGAGAPRLVLKRVGLPAAKLLGQAAQFTRQVATRDLAFAANARALYDALLGPVDGELTGVQHLIVVPHRGLWELPFQALQTPRGRYLIEERAVAYAPSASALKQLEARRRPRSARPRVVAFGDPRNALGAAALPHAAREAREVAGVYGLANAVVAIEGDATEELFRQHAPTADILHIATHGVLDNTSPLFSYVMLAGGAGRTSPVDGRLEGREMINMQLGAELVVLSACETARGRIANGEGVVGLSWALFAAGASTAAVSLWPVDSASTTEMMAAFHRERRLLIGASAPAPTAQALRAAQTRLLAKPESRHPFYWAGFVVIGVP